MEEIIKMLEAKEQELWQQLKTSRLVFGAETEATYRAAARWYTTQEILEQVKKMQDENN
jgi:hypothetical protein